MNRVFEVFVRNRVLFKNTLIVMVVAVCGVTYCIFGRRIFSEGMDKGHEEFETVSSLDESGWDIAEDNLYQDDIAGTEDLSNNSNQEALNYVYICGYVVKPGVYTCKEGTRVYELIQMAGGFHKEADKNYLNLVSLVTDGQKIYVPKEGEALSAVTGGNAGLNGIQGTLKVNINTADSNTLMMLPGIGKSRAEDIIAYRNQHGKFARIEDIMKVTGIKEAAYEKIKDYIIV